MRTNEIIREIQQLPIKKRMYVVEKTMHSIRKEEDDDKLKRAANALYEDYKNDEALTSFTNIDFDNFYEAK